MLKVGHIPLDNYRTTFLFSSSCLKVLRLTSSTSLPGIIYLRKLLIYISAFFPEISFCVSDVLSLPSEPRVRVLAGIAASNSEEANGEASAVSLDENFPSYLQPLPHIMSSQFLKHSEAACRSSFGREGHMPEIGQSLSHYSIVEKIGKGGMGEVFRAKDQKLGRDVAIKVLPEEFARDADRVARFQREAKLLASLNHPNIAAIYGLEESGGTNFLVLELVEGDTLADRIKAGAIPVEESLKLALQIAEALEAAHDKGVIHRDLKPANIKVTPEGKVKVLDFGLAKALAGEQADLDLSKSPTLSEAATMQGVILGTAAYMSPEQAKGRTVDKRADVWAFGCVVFEMMTGRSLFSADDVSQTLARVLERQPDFSSLPENLHPKISGMLERCLEKDVRNRYGSISDARVDIQKALAEPGFVLAKAVMAAEPKRKRSAILPWVAAIILVAAIVAMAVWNLRKTEPKRIIRFEYELPAGQQFTNLGFPTLALSPDGTQFVYSTPKGLYSRSVDELSAKLIAGTEGFTQQPFFSPDGKWIGYFSVADKKLKKIATRGGVPVTLCDVSQLTGACWCADDTIVYGHYANSIMRISANGGVPQPIVKSKLKLPLVVLPQILPDGESILYTGFSGPLARAIMVQSLKLGEPKTLFEGAGARYLPTGHIVYAAKNNLLAVPFEPEKLDTAGEPVLIVEGVFGQLPPQYAVSDSGTLAYVPITAVSAETLGRTLVWVDRTGKEEPLEISRNVWRYPKISPDGTKVALTAGVGNTDIYVWDIIGKTSRRLTFDENVEAVPIWTLDGKRIAFYGQYDIKPGIYWKSADGTGGIEPLFLETNATLLPKSFSRDGKTLILLRFFESDMSNQDIMTLSLQGDRSLRPLMQEKHLESQPKISPNGTYIAYVSNESGENEVYVRPFPEVNKGWWQVSTDGGDSPLWSPDGRELFYLNGDTVMAVLVETYAAFSHGTPKPLFRGRYAFPSSPFPGTQWDISADGKRFLMMKEPEVSAAAGPRPKISIVVNWFEELKKRVPLK